MRKFTKLFTTKATSIDDSTKTVRFKISDEQSDRMGEVVEQSWDFKNYMNNPIVLWGHNPDEPENVLGQAKSLETIGGETFAEMQFDDDINPKAGLVWKQILKGTLRTVSVGFISHDIEGNTLKNNELLEISVVPIPANPRAIALAYKAGEINRKDALWMQASMKKELENIEEQLKDAKQAEGLSTKDMEQVDAKLAEVLDVVGKLGATVSTLAETVASLQASKADDTADDADDEKNDGQEASGDVTDDKMDDDDSAKDGDTDQSGADLDDIDLDAELTTEQEAALDAQLATDEQAA